MNYLCRVCNKIIYGGSGAAVMPCPYCSGDAVRVE